MPRTLLVLLILLASLTSPHTARGDDIPAYFFKFVDAELKTLGIGTRDGLSITGVDGNDQINLDRIATNCTKLTRSECKAEVQRFLQGLASLNGDDRPAWPEAAPRLRVRVYDLDGAPDDYFVDTIRRELTQGLWLVLMLDSPKSTRSVSSADLERWGQDAEAAFAQARANHDAEPPAEVADTGPPKAALPAKVLTGDYYLTSLLAWPDRYLGGEKPAVGWFLVAPNRGLMAALRLDDVESLSVATELAYNFIANDEGLNPFSTSVFWWHGGVLERVQLILQNDAIALVATERMMGAIAAAATAEPSPADVETKSLK